MRKVYDPRCLVDGDDADCDQRIDRTSHQSVYRKLQKLTHYAASELPR